MARRLWTKDGPTEWGVEVFTEGECWTLSYYLQKLGGWPIYMLEREPWLWEHVVIKIGHNRYLDINGVQTRTQLLDAWPGLQLRCLGQFDTWEAFLDVMCGAHQYQRAHERSKSMAKRLAKRYVQTS